MTSKNGIAAGILASIAVMTAGIAQAAGDKVHFVRVGTLDEADRLPPDIHIFTSSKQPWVVIPDGQAAVNDYYEREKYWPEESIAWRNRILGSPG
jgi:hypothetical protein